MPSSLRASDSTSRVVILGTTVVLGVIGIALIFAPMEIAAGIGAADPRGAALLLQLYGAALFGLAMTGWLVRHSVIGGIFGRSYVVGNAAHSFIGAMALIRPALAHGASPVLVGLTIIYWVLAVAFFYLMFMATPGA